jgi:hypothetical protein
MPADPSRDDVKDAVLRSKGLNTIDDLDTAEPLLQLQPHHELVFIVELCEAQRPSKLGSLGGTHQKYEDTLSSLEDWLRELAGSGAIRMEKWMPGMPVAPMMPAYPSGTGTARSRPQSASLRPSRPQSAMSHRPRGQLMGLGAPGEKPLGPRIGAFEVGYKLVNTTSMQQYGPVQIYSKIATGKWPSSSSKLVQRVQERLQEFLKLDMGDHAVNAYVREPLTSLTSATHPLLPFVSPLLPPHTFPSRALSPASCLSCRPSSLIVLLHPTHLGPPRQAQAEHRKAIEQKQQPQTPTRAADGSPKLPAGTLLAADLGGDE